jgi:hypothetical protein
MGHCIIMLKHGLMSEEELYDNGPQDLVNKMQLCSLSIAYACPYHNPTTTTGYSVHNINISNPLTHKTPYTLSAIRPVQLKPGFIREEHTSPVRMYCQNLYNNIGGSLEKLTLNDLETALVDIPAVSMPSTLFFKT